MPERFADNDLSNMVRSHVEVGNDALQFTVAAGGYFNATYFVDGADRRLVLRIAPPDDAGFVFYERNMMAQEPSIHALIRTRTSVPVPEIIAYDTSRRFIDRDYLLMERLPGVPLPDLGDAANVRDLVLEQLGQYLRQIHEITSDRYGYLGEPHCMEPQSAWPAAFGIMWGKLIDDVAATGYYDSDQARRAKDVIDKHIRCFDRPVTSRLLHMDIWEPNILVDANGNITGIVDFDRALWGDKEIEFGILDYCNMSEPAFWRGYGVDRDTSPSAQVRRAFYLLYEVQKYIVIYHHRNREPASAARYARQSLAMLAQL